MGRSGWVYRLPVKSVSLDCCALLNSWSIAECPPHLWLLSLWTYLPTRFCNLPSDSALMAGSLSNVCFLSCYEQGFPPIPLYPPLCGNWTEKRYLLPLVNVLSYIQVFLFPPTSPVAFSLFEGKLSSGSLILQNLIFLLGSWRFFTQIILLVTYYETRTKQITFHFNSRGWSKE